MKHIILFALSVLSSSAAVSQELTLKIGDAPPNLSFAIFRDTAKTQTVDWNRMRNRVVIIDFWATWCKPCIESIPKMNELVEEFRTKPVTFLSITYEPEKLILPFLKKHPMNSTVGIDNDFSMFRSYKAWGIPVVVLINKERRVAAVVHPNNLTAEVISDVLAGRIPNVEQAQGWSDPEGAERYFRSLISKVKTN